nr:hypothetical protein BaRGS_017062 [Batillaria attramentaria]KAG5709200.1 hypothetical protein BaRGS_028656 [Batillaria attramentaria]
MFALVASLPAVFNIMALLLLVVYIYAIVGMVMFANVKLTGEIDEFENFHNFYHSVVLLIRLATKAGWNKVLQSLLIQPPDCDPEYITLSDGTKRKSQYGECGVPWMAIPYMVSYIFVVNLLLMNLYIGVILENYTQAHQREEVGVADEDYDMFYRKWAIYDPTATEFIPYEYLSDFIDDLEPPLRIPKPNTVTMSSLNLQILEGDRDPVRYVPFELVLDEGGGYSLRQGNKTWLQSAPMFLYMYGERFDQGDMKPSGPVRDAGSDKFGEWNATCYEYMAGAKTFRTCVKQWTDPTWNMVIFQQIFVLGTLIFMLTE